MKTSYHTIIFIFMLCFISSCSLLPIKVTETTEGPKKIVKQLMEYYKVNTYTDLRRKLMDDDTPLNISMSRAFNRYYPADAKFNVFF